MVKAVFDNMNAPEPKNNSVVVINDDLISGADFIGCHKDIYVNKQNMLYALREGGTFVVDLFREIRKAFMQ